MNTTQISKLLSLVLRHHPERLGLTHAVPAQYLKKTILDLRRQDHD